MKAILLLIGFIFASIHFAAAQQPPTSIPRIGYVAQETNRLLPSPTLQPRHFVRACASLVTLKGKTLLLNIATPME
jgi:hypothetical protein